MEDDFPLPTGGELTPRNHVLVRKDMAGRRGRLRGVAEIPRTQDAAVGYLSKHGIEQKLTECLRTVLRRGVGFSAAWTVPVPQLAADANQ